MITTDSDKRPKLERARSAAEKENLPMPRSGIALRRQFSQQETPVRRLSTSDCSGMEPQIIGGGQRRLPMQGQIPYQPQQQTQFDQLSYQQSQQPYGQPSSNQYQGGQQSMTMDPYGTTTHQMNMAQEDPQFYQVS